MYYLDTFKYLNCFSHGMIEKTVFNSVFGTSPRVRLLEMFLIGRELGYSISDMAEQSGASRSTVYAMLDEMLQSGLLIETKRYGRIRLFMLNEKNQAAQVLIKMFDQMLKDAANRAEEKYLMKIKAKN